MSYFSESAQPGTLLSCASLSLKAVRIRNLTGMFSPKKRPLSPNLHVPMPTADLLGLMEVTSNDGCWANASPAAIIGASARNIAIIVKRSAKGEAPLCAIGKGARDGKRDIRPAGRRRDPD